MEIHGINNENVSFLEWFDLLKYNIHYIRISGKEVSLRVSLLALHTHTHLFYPRGGKSSELNLTTTSQNLSLQNSY